MAVSSTKRQNGGNTPGVVRSYDTCDVTALSKTQKVLRDAGAGAKIAGKPYLRVKDLNIVVIESRVLVRDCIVRTLQAANDLHIVGAASVGEGLEKSAGRGASLFLLSAPGPVKIASLQQDIAKLKRETGAPVAVLADGENFDEVAQAFDMGAAGYISTNLSFEVCLEALRLMLAGGEFVPASMIRGVRHSNGARKPPLDQYKGMFTERQLAVLAALAEGKANKVIAKELKMQEGTVKAHVRNLMKLLKASNRTELALIVAENQSQMWRKADAVPRER